MNEKVINEIFNELNKDLKATIKMIKSFVDNELLTLQELKDMLICENKLRYFYIFAIHFEEISYDLGIHLSKCEDNIQLKLNFIRDVKNAPIKELVDSILDSVEKNYSKESIILLKEVFDNKRITLNDEQINKVAALLTKLLIIKKKEYNSNSNLKGQSDIIICCDNFNHFINMYYKKLPYEDMIKQLEDNKDIDDIKIYIVKLNKLIIERCYEGDMSNFKLLSIVNKYRVLCELTKSKREDLIRENKEEFRKIFINK